MSKVKVTIEGDKKMAGFIYGMIAAEVDSDKTPLTKISTPKIEAQKIHFEMESRI
jgi:hypothetical protein